MLKVYFYPTPTPPHLDILQAHLHDGIDVIYSEEIPNPPDYDVLIKAFPTQADLEASPNLRHVIVPYAGPVAEVQDLLRQHPHLSLHNLPYNTAPTAEMGLALMFAAAKFIIPADRKLRQNDWTIRYSDRPQLVLQGQTALILGYGRIGRHMAPVLRALGMRVLAVRRTLGPGDEQDPHSEVHTTEQLHELLPLANVLLVTLPETPETRGLVGAAELALLPQDAVLVNVGRGAVVEETPLYEALQNGRLAGAGLDVWYNYPRTLEARTHTPPSQHPFHELENVVMSPHRAGWLGDIEGGRMRMLADMLNVTASGAPMPNKINLTLGY